MQMISDDKFNKLDKIYSTLKKIDNTIKYKPKNKKNKLELKVLDTNMMKYREFLNQSKVFKKSDVINGLYMINTEAGTTEANKIFFLAEFTKLIFSNGLTFKDLDIETEYYGFGPSRIDHISFDIENINEIKDGGDYKIYNSDVVFTLKDKTKKSFKYEFYDDMIDKLKEDYKKFKFTGYLGYIKKCLYSDFNESNGKYRIILNDLFQYLDFVGENFYNKVFVKRKYFSGLEYDYNFFLIGNNGEYKDLSWQIDRSNFIYIDEIEKNKDINIIDSMSDDELFIYALNLYYKECSEFELNEKIFKVIKYLDKLIDKNYGMAYIVKAMLCIDGKIILKDYEEAKILLKKAYNLGLCTPSMLVWNENELYKKGV